MTDALRPICCKTCQAALEIVCPNGHDPDATMKVVRKDLRDPIAHLRAPKTAEAPSRRAQQVTPTEAPGPRCSVCRTELPRVQGRPRRYCDTCEPPVYRKNRLAKLAWTARQHAAPAPSASSSNTQARGIHGTSRAGAGRGRGRA